ncbi:hypothetical protein V7S78_07625 [Aquirufa regiilacus]
MSLLIQNLLPRLQKFAHRIELKEALVDRVWVIYGDGYQTEYEFERNGEIAVTRNGISYDGNWKILGSGRLKIKTDFTNNTLEYSFGLSGLLVLKISGVENQPFLLFDPNKIINGDIARYLLELENGKKQRIPEGPVNTDDDWLPPTIMIIMIVVIIAVIFSNTISK